MEATHDVLVVGAGCAGMRAAIEAYDRKAAELAQMFRDNFEQKFAAEVSVEITAAGPAA